MLLGECHQSLHSLQQMYWTQYWNPSNYYNYILIAINRRKQHYAIALNCLHSRAFSKEYAHVNRGIIISKQHPHINKYVKDN